MQELLQGVNDASVSARVADHERQTALARLDGIKYQMLRLRRGKNQLERFRQNLNVDVNAIIRNDAEADVPVAETINKLGRLMLNLRAAEMIQAWQDEESAALLARSRAALAQSTVAHQEVEAARHALAAAQHQMEVEDIRTNPLIPEAQRSTLEQLANRRFGVTPEPQPRPQPQP